MIENGQVFLNFVLFNVFARELLLVHLLLFRLQQSVPAPAVDPAPADNLAPASAEPAAATTNEDNQHKQYPRGTCMMS